MKNKVILAFLLSTWMLFGCNVIFNPMANKMLVRQGIQIIAHKTGVFDFGSVNAGFSSEAIEFKIENHTAITLYLTASPMIQFSGLNASDFKVDTSSTNNVIPAWLFTIFRITFSPTSTGARIATVTIANSVTSQNPYIFTVKGTGIPVVYKPEINVKQDATNIPCTIGSYDFGSVNNGMSSPAITFTIENLGNVDLNLTGNPFKVVSNGGDNFEFVVEAAATISPVSAGLKTTFTVTFKPTSEGNKSSTIVIPNNDSDENPYVFTVKGVGAPFTWAPEINVKQGTANIPSPSGTYNFGSFLVGSASNAIIFTIENLGNANLELTGNPSKIVKTGNDVAMFTINQSATVSPVLPSSSTTFTITFSATSEGVKTISIAIPNNDSNENPYIFTVTGTGAPNPEINVKQGTTNIPCNTGSYSFGNIALGSSSLAIIFTIESLGTTDLILTGTPKIAISGTDAAMFAINQTATSSPIAPSANTTFTISFSPTNAGNKSAVISISNNDADENPYTFNLTGTGTAPEINVKQGSTNIACTTGTFDFGSIYAGNSSSAVTFTIENLGTANLNLTGTPKIQISGTDAAMFTINQTATTSPVAPSANTTFTITFSPTSAGNKSATISIPNNDSDENPYTFTVTGTGLVGSEINIKQGSTNIACTTGSYNFGSIRVNTSSSAIIFTIENLGNQDLLLTGSPKIQISGTDAAMFSINQTTTTSTVTPGSSTTFSITFTPTSDGNKSATISIPNNDSDENPYTFAITGTGSTSMYCWSKRIGGTGSDIGYSMTTDILGNVFLTGCFSGTVDFGADFSVSDSKTSAGNTDIFITKINSNETYGWTKRIGGSDEDKGYSVAIDTSGNVYLTGYFMGTVDFGADFSVSDVKTYVGYPDIFVTKINSNETYGWTKRMGGTGSEYGFSITTDIYENIYLTGWFRGTIDFGADFSISDSKSPVGGDDIFIMKINANGTYGWTKRMGGTDDDWGMSVKTDSSGNIYVSGYFLETINFGADFSVSDSKTSVGRRDIFLTKINSNGSYGWTKRMGGVLNDYNRSMCIDSSDNVYLTGYFAGTINYGSDFSSSDIKNSVGGSDDIFVIKINSNGSYGWTKIFGGTSDDYGYSVATDSTGNIYLTGYFNGTVNFGADWSVSDSKTSAGAQDIFITKINANGSYGWTKRIGGSGNDYGRFITTYNSDDVYLIGYFNGTVDFGADFSVSDSKTSAGSSDIFITKLTP